MTNRETMPGVTGKIPKNANNKNGGSRTRTLGRARRRIGRQRQRRRHRRRVAATTTAAVMMVVVVVVVVVAVVVVRQKIGRRGWKKCKSPGAHGASSGDNTRR